MKTYPDSREEPRWPVIVIINGLRDIHGVIHLTPRYAKPRSARARARVGLGMASRKAQSAQRTRRCKSAAHRTQRTSFVRVGERAGAGRKRAKEEGARPSNRANVGSWSERVESGSEMGRAGKDERKGEEAERESEGENG